MPRSWKLAAFVLGYFVFTSVGKQETAMSQEKPNPKLAFLDAKSAGTDFQIQGEYLGKVGDQTVGAHVIARGSGKFDVVAYVGGLPGAGWDPSQGDKLKLTAETKDGVTKLVGDGNETTIANGVISVKHGDRTGELKRLHRESPTLSKSPPEGAIVLFSGSNADQWQPPKLDEGGLMGVGTRTTKVFENYTLHLEFRTPFMPNASGQGRGNSGMYLGDQYECQILDSFGLEGLDNECGGIYQNAKPKVNMCYPPLSWQTYDVDFTCAKFDADGKVTAPARVTIKHNGVVIHDNIELKSTPGGGRSDQKPGAIYLQDHGDPVRFKNIWIVEKK